MLAPKFVAVLAFLFISAVVAVPIAVDGLVEKRDAMPADYGDYGDYGSYGSYGTYPGPPPPPPPPNYGTYGSYGSYARSAEEEAA